MTGGRFTLSLDEIAIEGRARVDLGDIGALAESIATVGLLHPPVVRPSGSGWALVAGERRLAAMRQLGWTQTLVMPVLSLADEVLALTAERDENTCRKDLTPSEMVTLADRLEPRFRAEARQRMEAGRPSEDSAEGETREHVARAVGTSHDTLRKAREVVHAARNDDAPATLREAASAAVEEMDRTGRVSPAHQRLRAVEEELSADPGVALSTWRRNFERDLGRVVRLVTWDAEQVATNYDAWDTWDHYVRGLRRWIGTVEEHRPRHLRAIGDET